MRTPDSLLTAYPPGVQAIADSARRLIRKCLPDVQETADQSSPVIAYAYGAGYRAMVCTLILSQKEVKLGLVGGASLDDPRGLLTGAGKVHRHVRLRTKADVKHAGLRDLIRAADKARKARSST